MDVVGSEIGQKMRSAIKAKLTELGCYVDDELPDYVMVMVANKRTRSQMEDDLQLFLGDNTELFVNWLHQVLKKLQEVTVAPVKPEEKSKKESKVKDKKEKSKKGDAKKAKKKEKEKARKKLEKKTHKSKKKSKHQEILRPNIPPLLMNMEKPEPSITDVFAGQILKNHGVTLEPFEDTSKLDVKIRTEDVKRPIVPIIDPATIPSQSEVAVDSQNTAIPPNREEQLKEIDAIEAKMQGLKQKLVEQLDSMSDDEDFLNIRTEAEELMNDFAEDVFQEISQPPPATPPILPKPTPAPVKTLVVQPQKPQETITPEMLPQIELNLPKRPIRERLGAREPTKAPEKEKPTKVVESPERLTPEKEPEFRPSKSARSRLGSHVEPPRKTSVSDESDKSEPKKLTSKVSVSLPRGRSCASVVRVRPRPRVAPANSLLLRAVADAHKSLLNIPPKVEPEPQTVKRALVLPMRRCVDPQKIVIQVPSDADGRGDSRSDSRGDSRGDSHGDTISLGDPDSDSEISSKLASDITERDKPLRSITKVITNTEYVPSKIQHDDDVIETINIHNTTVDKSKDTQFIVTMDGYHPNTFLAKKLMTEGLLDEDDDEPKQKKESKEKDGKKDKESKRDKESRKENENKVENEVGKDEELAKEKDDAKENKNEPIGTQKRLSDTSEDSATQVIINQDKQNFAEKRKSVEVNKDELKVEDATPPQKKRKASPIVFDVDKKEKRDKEEKGKEKKDETASVRERTISASSDSHVVLTTPPNPHKYDAIPPLSAATVAPEKPWCRAFPLCRFGAACAFAHPRCKFAAACTRRACPYSHAPHAPPLAQPPPPQIASHVVPAANYKSISTVPNLCKFYPGCANPACHYYHPKPCRYGKACVNKLECNFYHHDVTWK
ncbi:zinc finger CCCH domain-containing protein 14 [Aricia agestis]|uniref:zinc finger CCCH domain-containing protein 14 n=1 Tax=Aricia agestis TaxID=91739 RepID=UPI001C2098DF|nr:zinc finger CCCH domain-containing protein 14 [Aricia agestis]